MVIYLTLILMKKIEDSFVALGGEPNRQGVVFRSTIIELVKNFELTIEIEEYLESVGIDDNELNFEDFCKLFDSPGEDSYFF
jgi:hypothetical protein